MTSLAIPKPSNYTSSDSIFNKWCVHKGCKDKISLLFKVADLGLSPARYLLNGKKWIFVESEGKYYFDRQVTIAKDRGVKRVIFTVGAALFFVPSLVFCIVKLIAIASKTIHFSHPFDPKKPLLENRADGAIYEDALKILNVSEEADQQAVNNAYRKAVRTLQQRRHNTFGCIRARAELSIQDAHRAYFTIMKQKFPCELSAIKQTISELEERFVPEELRSIAPDVDPTQVNPLEVN